jgi:hypothetical protein
VLFRDGVEAGGQPAPAVLNDNAPLTLSLDTGQDGAMVSARHVDISGSFDGPPSTGIASLNVAGYRAGKRWLIPSVPLQSGANMIEVAATTVDGKRLSRRLTIVRDDNLAPSVRLVVHAAPKHAPAGVRFRLDLREGISVTRVRLDYEGDGAFELDSAQAEVDLSHTYALPGVYRARARVDIAGPPPTEIDTDATVLVRHVGETRASLCAAFEFMRRKLVARDIDGALAALQPRLHAPFRELWTSLGSNLPNVANQLGFIADGSVSNDFAELVVARPRVGQVGQHSGFRVHFDLSPDGVWRIGSM